MIFELFGMYALILILLFGFAELGRQKALGIIGSGLIIILGLWVISDGLQLQVGEDITTTETLNENYTLFGNLLGNSSAFSDTIGQDVATVANYSEDYNENVTGLIISTKNETIRKAYEDVNWSFTSVMTFTDFIGIVLILLGIYGFVQYMTVKENTNV